MVGMLLACERIASDELHPKLARVCFGQSLKVDFARLWVGRDAKAIGENNPAFGLLDGDKNFQLQRLESLREPLAIEVALDELVKFARRDRHTSAIVSAHENLLLEKKPWRRSHGLVRICF
ncbi:MAG: hypothetical protein ACXQTL_00620 [Methanosarcinales archaeon]